MKAVVLAGGFGTRIKPLTYSIPKPMLPLAGKPILEHVVNLLKNHGITDIVFLLYFQPEAIKNYFGDGSGFGVKVNYTIPSEDYGTAGAVKFASEHLRGDEPFLVISGDLLTDVDLKSFVEFHKNKKSMVTIGLTSVKDPLQFGIVITDSDGKVVKFLEKPGWGEVFSDSINAGIYAMDPAVLDSIPGRQAFDFSHDLFPRLLGEGKPLFGFLLRGYWRDVGDATSYWEANMDILAGRLRVKGSGKRLDIVGKDIWLGDNVDIAPDAELEGTVIIGEGVKIGEKTRIKDSIIGDHSVIHRGAKILKSILWKDTHIDENPEIEGSVICSNVRIGKEVKIEPGVVVSENCSIGQGAVLKEGVKIWPSKEVEPGAIVSSNLIWGERWKRSLFEESKVTGLSNFELTPEFAAKLGAAFASFLPRGSSVLVGRDTHKAPRMIKRAFVAGVLSAGVNARDLKAIPIPILRYKLQTFGEVGGAYFKYSPENPEVTEILFYDSNGFETSTSFEKSFERIFQREDFRRVEERAVGRISDLSGIVDFYKEGFIKTIKRENIKEKRFRIVVDFSFGPSSEYFPSILNELGCEVISLNAYTTEHGGGIDVDRALGVLSNIVKATDATAGFWLDPWAERLYFVDETGKVYKDIDSLLLLFHLILKSEDSGTIAVPLFVPSYLEEVAEENGFRIKRTKNSVRALSEAVRDKDVRVVSFPDGRFIFTEFHIAYDGMFALAKTLELMAKLSMKLSEVSKGIPKINFLHTTVPCRWESKGVVMRKVSQEALGKKATFLDGVKISFNGSWVLVFPDQYKSIIHLYTEAKSEKDVRLLIDEYTNKIGNWVRS
jgi:mannose-1-phosphate guanylyltransferase / phosphomannomutase